MASSTCLQAESQFHQTKTSVIASFLASDLNWRWQYLFNSRIQLYYVAFRLITKILCLLDIHKEIVGSKDRKSETFFHFTYVAVNNIVWNWNFLITKTTIVIDAKAGLSKFFLIHNGDFLWFPKGSIILRCCICGEFLHQTPLLCYSKLAKYHFLQNLFRKLLCAFRTPLSCWTCLFTNQLDEASRC